MIIDYSSTGIAVLSDSLDVVVNEGNFVKGLNGFVFYQSNYIQRIVVVECRSLASATSFLYEARPGNQILFIDHYYYVKDVTLNENWGNVGTGQISTYYGNYTAWDKAVWTYTLTLVRDL